MFPNFVLRRRGDVTIWIDGTYADPAFIDQLSDADSLLAESNCQIVKDQRKIKVGRSSVPIAGKLMSLYIKRYNAFSLRYKLVSPFVPSGALRALRGAAILRAAGVATAPPVAAVEHRQRGALSKSFFISEEIAGGETIDQFWQTALNPITGPDGLRRRRRFLSELAALFQSLHAQRIYHNDLKDANILAVTDRGDGPFRFFLLDLEGVKRLPRLSGKRIIKNLVQINRTLGRYLRGADKLFFLKRYLGAQYGDRRARRQWIACVAKESNRWNELKMRMRKDMIGAKPLNHD